MLTRVHSSAADNISKINSSKRKNPPSLHPATGLWFDVGTKYNFCHNLRFFDSKRVMQSKRPFPNRL